MIAPTWPEITALADRFRRQIGGVYGYVADALEHDHHPLHPNHNHNEKDTIVTAVKYRQKPVVVEAIQWTGDNVRAVKAFVGRMENMDGDVSTSRFIAPFAVDDEGVALFRNSDAHVLIEADRAWVPVARDSWIIRDLGLSVRLPDDFAASYEAIAPDRPDTPDVKTERGKRITVKRMCNGCGRSLGDVTDAELDAAVSGARLPDVREECGCKAVWEVRLWDKNGLPLVQAASSVDDALAKAHSLGGVAVCIQVAR